MLQSRRIFFIIVSSIIIGLFSSNSVQADVRFAGDPVIFANPNGVTNAPIEVVDLPAKDYMFTGEVAIEANVGLVDFSTVTVDQIGVPTNLEATLTPLGLSELKKLGAMEIDFLIEYVKDQKVPNPGFSRPTGILIYKSEDIEDDIEEPPSDTTRIGIAEDLNIQTVNCPLLIFDPLGGFKLIENETISMQGSFKLKPEFQLLNTNSLTEDEMESIKSDIESLNIVPNLNRKIRRLVKIQRSDGNKGLKFNPTNVVVTELEVNGNSPEDGSRLIEFIFHTPFTINAKKRFIKAFVPDKDAQQTLLSGGSIPQEQIDTSKSIDAKVKFKLRKLNSNSIFEDTLPKDKSNSPILFTGLELFE